MADSPTDNLNFEQALAELERVVRQLEDGQTGLDEALKSYERGIGLLNRCYTQLKEAEQRIQVLTGIEGDEPIVKPFEHSATADVARGSRRPKKSEKELPF